MSACNKSSVLRTRTTPTNRTLGIPHLYQHIHKYYSIEKRSLSTPWNEQKRAHLDTVAHNSVLNKHSNGVEHHHRINSSHRIKCSDSDQTIIDSITAAKCAFDIVQIIHKSLHNIGTKLIYSLAIKQCLQRFNDSRAVSAIMDVRIAHAPQNMDVVAFNLFFSSMRDSPEHCVRYLDVMTNTLGLTPDLVTFATLIKSCRERGNTALAEKYWDMMRTTYGIEPNAFVYNEMLTVYAKTKDKKKASKLFREYLQQMSMNGEPADMVVFNGYLSVCACCAALHAVNKGVKLMHMYKLAPDMITMTHLMNAYNLSNKPQKTLKIFDAICSSKFGFNQPSAAQLFYKCVALCLLMKQHCCDWERKHALYTQAMHVMNVEFEGYGWTKTPLIGRVLFECAIVLWFDRDPMQIVRAFEALMEQQMIGYLNVNHWSKQCCIDLHFFVPLQAKFVLLYIFGYKLHEDEDELDLGKEICIVTGVGKHCADRVNKGRLQRFVINELETQYQPPIRCTLHANNTMLTLNKDDVELYRQNKNNYARTTLIRPLTDCNVPGLF